MSTSNKDDSFFARIVSLADALAADFDVLEAANLLVHGCVDFLSVRDAGIVVENEHNRLQVLAATSEETRILEFLELQSNQGPCLEAFNNGAPVQAPDLIHGGGRWPTFRTYALGLGFRVGVRGAAPHARQDDRRAEPLLHHRTGAGRPRASRRPPRWRRWPPSAS